MRQVLDRNLPEYARAVQKVYDLQPRIVRHAHDHFEVAGSQGSSYDVYLDDKGAYGCACRFGRKESLCYHVVACDIHRREALARFEAEAAGKPFVPASRTLTAIRQQELEAHRADCAKCGAGEECRRAGKLLERMESLARQTAQAA